MLGDGSIRWLVENQVEVAERLAGALRKDLRSMSKIAKDIGVSGTTLLDFIKKKQDHTFTVGTLLRIEKYIMEKEAQK